MQTSVCYVQYGIYWSPDIPSFRAFLFRPALSGPSPFPGPSRPVRTIFPALIHMIDKL